MIGCELKLMLNQDKGYLVADKAMSIEQLNLPPDAKIFKLSYWLIKILNYDNSSKEIFCKIISYDASKSFDEHQLLMADKLREVQSLRFRSINTYSILNALYKPNRGAAPIIGYKAVPIPINHFDANSIRRPQNQIINTNFYVPIKDVQFKSSCISIQKKFEEYYKPIELIIHNQDIKQEFDAVKNYFANVLKTKKIQVFVNIEITDDKITLLEVKSPEIERINKQFIDDVRIEFVKSNIKKSNQKSDKNIYTVAEFFENLTDEISNLSLFYNDEKDFLEDVIQISNSKHYRHLRFLSSKHAHDIIKLRFVQKPLSFIFLISGDRNYHFIWETINTEEATYIWTVEKNISQVKSTLQHIENAIKLIKEKGKMAYLISTEEKLNRVFHDYSDSKNGFTKWKDDLNLILT